MKKTGQTGSKVKNLSFEKPLNVPSHTKHAWNSCNYRNMHRSLRYFVLLERIASRRGISLPN